MDIPALSMALSQSKAMGDIGTAVLSRSLDTARDQGAALVNMIDSAAMERSVNPYVGANFDVSV